MARKGGRLYVYACPSKKDTLFVEQNLESISLLFLAHIRMAVFVGVAGRGTVAVFPRMATVHRGTGACEDKSHFGGRVEVVLRPACEPVHTMEAKEDRKRVERRSGTRQMQRATPLKAVLVFRFPCQWARLGRA